MKHFHPYCHISKVKRKKSVITHIYTYKGCTVINIFYLQFGDAAQINLLINLVMILFLCGFQTLVYVVYTVAFSIFFSI